MTENHLFNIEKNYVSLEDKDLLINFLKDEQSIDFSEYSEASVRRRISKILAEVRMNSVSGYIEHLRSQEGAMDQFIEKFTVNVTEMFRDPFFFQALIDNVFPILKEKDEIKIWSAGCSTGEEALSLAILLQEHGLLHKTTILGTDLSDSVLENARKHCYRNTRMTEYENAYADSGGMFKLSNYYSVKGELACFDEGLFRNIRFEKQNLMDDPTTIDFDIVLCRNVLIYFNANLQNKVIGKLSRAIVKHGFLMLGSKESVIFYHNNTQFQEIKPESRIYQKLR